VTTATKSSTAYDELLDIVREAGLLSGSAQMLAWDQEVLMPPRGVEYRSRQIAQLARLHHERFTDPKVGELIAACEADGDLMRDPQSPEAVNVRELRRDYDRKTRLPASLVEEEAELASLGQHVWKDARAKTDFEAFRPTLERIIELVRRKADHYGWPSDAEPWDALAEDYEPGCRAADVAVVFEPLRDRLRTLIADLTSSATKPSNAFNELRLSVDAQRRFVRFVAESIGFDFDRGRLDVSTHPFCSGSHCNDVRLTTRFAESNVNDALGSTMHEAGHGIYEQGLLAEHTGTPMGTSVSLGIHESQSRMWENQVGRSRAFWDWCSPRLGEFFGDSVDGLTPDEVYGAVNIVKPDFIRVEADEVTYNMHIMVRFEIERELMSGTLKAADIPEAWNARYRDYLGLEIPNDAVGCLQDIHWAGCSVGYFPTYTLGNLYAAQLFDQAREDMPDLLEQFGRGEFDGLRAWLNEHVHAHGRRYPAADLCEVVTGKPLSHEPLMRHLEGKIRPLYGG
jgi:carboxypeptidase Taq